MNKKQLSEHIKAKLKSRYDYFIGGREERMIADIVSILPGNLDAETEPIVSRPPKTFQLRGEKSRILFPWKELQVVGDNFTVPKQHYLNKSLENIKNNIHGNWRSFRSLKLDDKSAEISLVKTIAGILITRIK